MKKISLLVVLALVIVFGCRHHPDDTPITTNTTGGGTNTGGGDTTHVVTNPHPCSPDTVYFTNTILPLIISNCAMSGCHDAATHAEGVRLYDYTHIMNYVVAGNASQSNLYGILFNGMPPANAGGSLSTAQINEIATWINQGALNNSCIADCDPNATITFSGILWPIVQANCTGCHSGSSPGGGISLTNYTTVHQSITAGSFMNSLHGSNGAIIMPQGTSGLPSCQIDQFQAWLDAGAPNN
jgi:Na+-translocating ferredoxin:NAD+ oxidoreductase RNF subunit RnfB